MSWYVLPHFFVIVSNGVGNFSTLYFAYSEDKSYEEERVIERDMLLA